MFYGHCEACREFELTTEVEELRLCEGCADDFAAYRADTLSGHIAELRAHIMVMPLMVRRRLLRELDALERKIGFR